LSRQAVLAAGKGTKEAEPKSPPNRRHRFPAEINSHAREGGMSGIATSNITNAEDYQAELSDVFAGFVVTTPGAFTARVSRNVLHHFHLLRARESLPRVAFVSLQPDRVFVSFSFDPANSLIWRGLSPGTGEIMLHGRGERLHQRTRSPCSWGFISLTPTAFAAACETATGNALGLPELGRVLRPAPGDRKRLVRVHRDVVHLAETQPRILGHPEVVRAMEQELESALMSCLANCQVRPETGAMRHASEIMARFEDLLAGHPDQKLQFSEMCRVLDVTVRSMYSYCKAFLGVGPQKYMLLRRLHLVHAAILRSEGQSTRVAEFARNAGFTQLGRFAAHYRAAFGETPSATLRRTRAT
jgi:AraC-like DNA-binding protein